MQAIIAIADNKEIFDNLFTYSILCWAAVFKNYHVQQRRKH